MPSAVLDLGIRPELWDNPDVNVHALIEANDTAGTFDPKSPPLRCWECWECWEFGAPNASGWGGIVYGGCQAGREVPTSGVWITIPETAVPRTSTLRWQVAQSRHREIMAIGEIFLELLQPIAEEHTIVERQEDLRGPKDGADQMKLTWR
ncbi:unnamed protein product [Cladocopium goreaui]|uniref:Apple domain-containing protein n=1 Tax=Cladocopium goreaui TaxID=2562237 RepID=A0A9P1FRU7_9DINO|nr:unnamed protein product [Cladocopium goreaui]